MFKAVFGKGEIPFIAPTGRTWGFDEILVIHLIKRNTAFFPKLAGFLMLINWSHLIDFKCLIAFLWN
jgi:hypothetical protein